MILGTENLTRMALTKPNSRGDKFVTSPDVSLSQTHAMPFDTNIVTATHTPQNSTATFDSIAATCDSVVSPRNRRKGIKINTKTSLKSHVNDSFISSEQSSGADTPPSPLSEARTTTNIPDITDNFYVNTNTNSTNDAKSQLISYLYANAESDKIELIDKYRDKLQELNALFSPMQLFHDIDLMIRNYQKLKKEYCLQWELQQLYRQQIRSLLKQS